MKVKAILEFAVRFITGLICFALAQEWAKKTLAVEPLKYESEKLGIFKKKHQGMRV